MTTDDFMDEATFLQALKARPDDSAATVRIWAEIEAIEEFLMADGYSFGRSCGYETITHPDGQVDEHEHDEEYLAALQVLIGKY